MIWLTYQNQLNEKYSSSLNTYHIYTWLMKPVSQLIYQVLSILFLAIHQDTEHTSSLPVSKSAHKQSSNSSQPTQLTQPHTVFSPIHKILNSSSAKQAPKTCFQCLFLLHIISNLRDPSPAPQSSMFSQTRSPLSHHKHYRQTKLEELFLSYQQSHSCLAAAFLGYVPLTSTRVIPTLISIHPTLTFNTTQHGKLLLKAVFHNQKQYFSFTCFPNNASGLFKFSVQT